MNDPVWNAMVSVLVQRRSKQNPQPTTPARPEPRRRRRRPTTLRSVRELLVDEHYAMLSDARY